MSDPKTRHKDALDKMLRLLEQTLPTVVKPKPGESKRQIALRRWMATLGAMLKNVGRSISRLDPTDDAVAITILCRSMFEYRVKALYFLKDNEAARNATKQYMTPISGYVNGLQKLPTKFPGVTERLSEIYEAWIKAGGQQLHAGNITLTKVALALTDLTKIKVDDKQGRYSDELIAFQHIPSWFVHGEPQLLAEFFPNWLDENDHTFTTSPTYHGDALIHVKGAIGDIYAYLLFVRKKYGMMLLPLKYAAEAHKELFSPEFRRLLEESNS
jgi:hypothetical protein